uniref:Uncharacterized protein n=1 Tax=Oryza barthii TaxID=65489 RepID=A0A0D3G2Z0_9ORYZ
MEAGLAREARPMEGDRIVVHEGWPAGDAGAGVPHVGKAYVVVEHRCVRRGFASGERRMKT